MRLETYKFIGLFFGNPISRQFMKKMMELEEDGRSRLDHFLAFLAGLERPQSVLTCTYFSFFSFLVGLYSKLFQTDLSDFIDQLSKPATRRGLETVIRSLIKYGVTVPQKLDAPFLVVWNFTNACNLKCKHCYQHASTFSPNELTLEEKLNVVKELEDAGVAAIAFSGGEPLIHPHFFKVAEEASKRGFYVAVATNGTLITESVAKKLKKIGVNYVEVSVDSANPAIHDAFRGVKGAWRRAVEGAANTVKAGIVTSLATTVTKFNWREATQIMDLAEKIGAWGVVFFNFVPVGRGREIARLDLSPHERELFLKLLYLESLKRRVAVLSTAPQYARISLQLSGYRDVKAFHFTYGDTSGLVYLANFIGGCGAGRIYCAIQPDGAVTPCVFMPDLEVGSLREVDFQTLWTTSEVFKRLRDRSLLKGSCATCEFKYVCGGCRARALAYTGDYMGPDPGCIRNVAVESAGVPQVETSILKEVQLAVSKKIRALVR